MYGNNSSRNRFNANQQSYWPRGTFEHSAVSGRELGGQNVFPNQKSHFTPRDRPSGFNSQSTYTHRDLQQYGGDYSLHQRASSRMKVDHQDETWTNNATMVPAQNINWVHGTTRFPLEHHNSFYHKGNNSICNAQSGSYEGNTLPHAINQGNNSIYNSCPGNYDANTSIPHAINQSQTLPHYGVHHGQQFQQNNIPCSTIDTIEQHGHRKFQANNVSIYPNQVSPQTPVSQEDADKMWLKQWLEQRHIQNTNDNKSRKTLKVLKQQEAADKYEEFKEEVKQLQQEACNAEVSGLGTNKFNQ